MKKDLYSVGEVSKWLNITITTLHHYDKLDLIKPIFKDPDTGYRYYSYAQIFQISRIRYFQRMGLSLSEIKSTLKSSDGYKQLINFLLSKKEDHKNTILQLNKEIEDIDWSVKFYTYISENFNNLPEKKYFKERYMLYTPWESNDDLVTSEFRLNNLRKRFIDSNNINVRRQWCYILNLESFFERKFDPICNAMVVEGDDISVHPNICTIPEGEYLCFFCRLWENDFGDINKVKSYLADANIIPTIAYSWEYDSHEAYQKEYEHAICEIQIPLSNTLIPTVKI